MGRRPAFIVLIVGLTLAAPVLGPPAEAGTPARLDGPAPENEVKAAFLYNFALFVDWPADAPAPTTGRFEIKVMGDDALADAVGRFVAGKSVNGMTLDVRRAHDIRDLDECHILFVGPSEDWRLAEILDALDDRPVLTVGETGRFARLGGMIRFKIVDGRLRFEINLNAAREPGLILSSRLLGVASAVNGHVPGQR